MSKLNLAEKPFIGFQGEGATTGLLSLFIRFSGCNLRCRECDSKFTWNKNLNTSYSFNNILEIIKDKKVKHIIFTGGEPLIQDNKEVLIKLILFLQESGLKHITYEVETNGAVYISNEEMLLLKILNVRFNVSPKFNFEMIEDFNYNLFQDAEIEFINQLEKLNFNYIVKFLFNSEEDLELINKYAIKNQINISKVYIQPKAICSEEVISIVKKHYNLITSKYQFNLSFRTHILIFEDKKGV